MTTPRHPTVRFSLITAIVWLLVAGGIIFVLWQVINRISAGNLPISTPLPDQTQVYQTIEAMLTPRHTNPVETTSPIFTPSPSPKPTQVTSLPLPSQNNISTPSESNQAPTPTTPCDRAAAGNPIDVTIPDDSLISPGQSFIKTWKLVNYGSCSWTTAYSASFFYGDRMQAPEAVALNEMVLPAQSIEISVDMVAPDEAGTYQGNWKLSNPAGDLFGIGPNGDSPFWVRIIVPERPSSTATVTQGSTSTPGPTATQGTPGTISPTGSPTSATTVMPPMQASGELKLVPGEAIDLDTVTKTSEGDDLKYEADASNYHWLKPEDEAMIGVYGSLEPIREDCQSAGMSRAPIAVESLSVGTYLCYITGQGRFGRALFANLDTNNFTLTLDLLTWVQP